MLACLSPQVSLLLITALWILLPISYIAIEDPSNRNHPSPHPTSYKEIPYSPLKSYYGNTSESSLSVSEMLPLVWQTLPPFIGLYVSNVCKQLLISGVMTTIAFSNVPFTPRNQYLLYVFASGVGDLLGRPYLCYVSRCGIEDKCTFRKPWFLVLLNIFILLLMVFVSWYRFWFLFNFYTGAALVMVNTLLTGMVFLTAFQFAGEGLSIVKRRFCRAFLTGSLWTANVAVALIGLTVEYHLQEHCVYSFDQAACLTRSPTAWDPSVSCVL